MKELLIRLARFVIGLGLLQKPKQQKCEADKCKRQAVYRLKITTLGDKRSGIVEYFWACDNPSHLKKVERLSREPGTIKLITPELIRNKKSA